LRSWLGDLVFRAHDYVLVPRGILHRFELTPGIGQHWLVIEAKCGVGIPAAFRNGSGQLRMDAPYCHRDFRGPVLGAPLDEGIRRWVVKRGDAFSACTLPRSPLDVVGWDGAVYPFAFSIHDYQPRVGQFHLPPTVHGTFSAGASLISSFVPRPLDFGQDAVPCPYPHSSVDIDEVLFYASGDFTSRRGVGVGSLSHHPAGIPHGPHPGAYEGSLGKTRTEELAIMLDLDRPLSRTPFAAGVEDPDYHASFVST
jgi:homogentisate 1,2-dioxygenase